MPASPTQISTPVLTLIERSMYCAAVAEEWSGEWRCPSTCMLLRHQHTLYVLVQQIQAPRGNRENSARRCGISPISPLARLKDNYLALFLQIIGEFTLARGTRTMSSRNPTIASTNIDGKRGSRGSYRTGIGMAAEMRQFQSNNFETVLLYVVYIYLSASLLHKVKWLKRSWITARWWYNDTSSLLSKRFPTSRKHVISTVLIIMNFDFVHSESRLHPLPHGALTGLDKLLSELCLLQQLHFSESQAALLPSRLTLAVVAVVGRHSSMLNLEDSGWRKPTLNHSTQL
ncbi:hypothetical protein BC835DRAFT_1311313 [Cytidiella melzeri]|nr:hypothetical protein BC835DRAFT_1311313 [Cytidiella melzeri]